MEPPPATRELVERGVEDPKRFVPNAELTVERERIVIRDEEQRVAESFELKRVSDPTAFKSRQGQNQPGSGFSRLVVFTEESAGHFNGNPVFHVMQCLDSDPYDLVELIADAKDPGGGRPPGYIPAADGNYRPARLQ